MAASNNLLARLVKTWPALPYMALGAMMASFYIASSGTAWLSDTEIDGVNLPTLFIAISLASGAVLVAATFAAPSVRRILEHPLVPLGAGVLSSIGSLLVILVGPYYLGGVLPSVPVTVLFDGAGVLFGAGLGVIALRCAQLYGSLAPRQVILYVAYSQFVVGASFFIVLGSPSWAPIPGGPSLAGILTFVGLPLVAGLLAMLSRYSERPAVLPTYSLSRSALPRSFWKLLAVVLVFSFIVCSVYASVVVVSPVGITLDGSRLVMLARMLLAMVLAVVAVGTEGETLNFGKLYSVVMVGSVALVACLPLVSVLHTVLSQIVSLASVVFELFLWCTLAFIVYQRRVSAIIVFGFGYGAYWLAGGLGWVGGVPLLASMFQALGESFAYMVLALLVLACAFLVFSESEFGRLFAPVEKGAPTLDELLMQGPPSDEPATGEEEPQRKGRFGSAIEALAETYQLSPRETDVLRCLAMGYNSSTTASKLSISWNTVRTHTRNVYGKLDVHSQQELIALVDEATAADA